MTRPAAVALAAALALCAPPVAAQEATPRGPSTAKERKRAVDITRRLERDPLAKGGDEDRVWLFQWIVDIPDIQIRTCESPLDQLKEDAGARHGRDLFLQHVFGITAFLVENPKKKDDWVAQQVAGLQSVLRAYAALKKADPEVRWRTLEAYERARREGRLAAAIRETMPGCDPATDDDMGAAPDEAI